MNVPRPPVSDYDVVDFPSLPFAASHPDRLATLGQLFGLQAPDVEHARILEIGCGAGGNILPMAATLPHSECVALDLSATQIEEGRRIAESVELTNLRLEAMDLVDLDASLGEFDYIICHGVYSWTTDAAREKLLEICQQRLTPTGIAYVNYNTFPGWHIQGMVRDMISYHANKFDDPQQRTAQARAMIQFLEAALANDQSTYSQLVRNELQASHHYSDKFLFHALLNVVNHPCYLHEFVDRAQQAELQYLGDADITLMWAGMLPAETQTTLREISQQTVDFEQHLDYLRNTMSRRSLLCHPAVQLDRTLRVASLENLFLASNLHADPATGTVGTPGPVTFRAPDGRTVATANPNVQVALDQLSQQWPAAIAFAALRTAVSASGAGSAEWESDLLNCVAAGLVEPFQRLPSCARHVEEQPRATPLARHQAAAGGLITDLRHYARNLTPMDAKVLANLDGQHGVAELAVLLEHEVASGSLQLVAGASAVEPPDYGAVVNDSLERLGRQAFLLRQ